MRQPHKNKGVQDYEHLFPSYLVKMPVTWHCRHHCGDAGRLWFLRFQFYPAGFLRRLRLRNFSGRR